MRRLFQRGPLQLLPERPHREGDRPEGPPAPRAPAQDGSQREGGEPRRPPQDGKDGQRALRHRGAPPGHRPDAEAALHRSWRGGRPAQEKGEEGVRRKVSRQSAVLHADGGEHLSLLLSGTEREGGHRGGQKDRAAHSQAQGSAGGDAHAPAGNFGVQHERLEEADEGVWGGQRGYTASQNTRDLERKRGEGRCGTFLFHLIPKHSISLYDGIGWRFHLFLAVPNFLQHNFMVCPIK
mmetsp:Transcript_25213/g.58246  ORF Transcript_25213/g.58246 Transcript_25213/m.58246 type:complete len:237 (-) Transcript_25213:65-775(-)